MGGVCGGSASVIIDSKRCYYRLKLYIIDSDQLNEWAYRRTHRSPIVLFNARTSKRYDVWFWQTVHNNLKFLLNDGVGRSSNGGGEGGEYEGPC